MARHKGRAVDGILPLDKPAGMTSNQVLQRVRRLYRAAKAGHTGSLDAIATGMLPLCFGEATKMSGFLLDADKGYRVTCRLGVSTDTGDSEGEVEQRAPVPTLSPEGVTEALQRFHGVQQQVPPMYSAVRHQGKRLYRLARQGVQVERKPRRIEVYTLSLLRIGAQTLDIELDCSKGTYVRTLVAELGDALGCGAHVIALRRLWSGPFQTRDMVTVTTLESVAGQGEQALDKLLLPADRALADKPALNLNENITWYLRRGQPVMVPHAPTEGTVRLYNGGRFIGIGRINEDGLVGPERLFRRPLPAADPPPA